jgi:hypothetical protein
MHVFGFLFLGISFVLGAFAQGDRNEKVLKAAGPDRSYQIGERFTVQCLNRTSEGEHVGISSITIATANKVR